MLASRRDFAHPSTVDDAFIDGLSLRAQLAIAMNALERHGFCQDVAGHVVARDGDGKYLTNPWGYTWDCVRASDMLVVDGEGTLIEPNGSLRPSPSLELHFGILRKRPDVGVTFHNHPLLATAWGTTGAPLAALDQTSALFFERQAWCNEFGDVETLYDPAHFDVTGDALGWQAHLLWMNHHGVIVAHRDVPFATVYALYVERSVQINLAARQLGDAKPLSDAVARKMRDMLQNVFVIPDVWKAIVRATLRARPDVIA
ncbi:MAG: class II aldolase/adducin family protein [Candidatus Eremiobacteraeota bacterium]|nr:class II aldolase/adducin family protein [Candidatus Eremiobacteraeota bacterium]